MARLRLAEGIKWRKWSDGISAFVPSTCETHVLSPALLPVFIGDSLVMSELEAALSVVAESSASESAAELGDLVRQLLSLKILDVID